MKLSLLSLTLYDNSAPPQVIGRKLVGEKTIRVGRDPSSDWVIDDPDRTVSRDHFHLRVSDEGLMLRAVGKNDVYIGNPRQKVAKDVEVRIEPGAFFPIGAFLIRVEEPAKAVAGHESDVELGVVSQDLNCAVFDAFCDGAQLDPSQFVAEDPIEMMKQVGAVYRHAVLGLGRLLRQRGQIRATLLADRTSVGAQDNNLMKWAPAHRLTIDLLTSKQDGFLAGPDAVEASIRDLELHVESLLEGHRRALECFVEELRPSDIASRAPKGMLRDHASGSWALFEQLHAALERDLAQTDRLALTDGFAEGYDQGSRRKRA